MPRQNGVVESLIPGSCKIRKRGSSLSSSSVLQNYRFKRAILVGKPRGSRSSTPRYIEGTAFWPGVNPFGIHNVQHYVNGQVVIESVRDTLESCSKAQTDSYQEEVAVA